MPDAQAGDGGGRILVGSQDCGGGVAIFPRLVITAGHVLGSRLPADSVSFQTQAGHPVDAMGSVQFIDGRDAATFGLAADVAWSRLAAIAEGERWYASSTGRANDPALTGTVTQAGLHITDDAGRRVPVLQLLVDQDIGNFRGYSGGAVLNSAGEVTAILMEQLPQRLGTPRPPASNVLFALPVGDVIGRLPIGMPVPPVRPLPAGTAAADRDQPPSGYLLCDCFAGLIDAYSALCADMFPGPSGAADRLEESIRQPADGFLVATAPPGYGKTALVAGILNKQPPRVAYHFFKQWYDDGLTELFFLQNVLQQLTWLLGWHNDIPDSIGALRAMYHHMMSQPAAASVTVVLDGVDDVTDWQLRPYLSRRLPGNLSFVVTMQDKQDSATRYGLPRDQTNFLDLRTRITQAGLMAGQQLNALLGQLQQQMMQTAGAVATEEAQYQELQLEADANTAAAESAARVKMTSNAAIMKGFEHILDE